jgi:hypothetical protein
MYYLSDCRDLPKIKRIEIQPFDDDLDIEVIWVKSEDDYSVAMREVLEVVNDMFNLDLTIKRENSQDYLFDGDKRIEYVNVGWECEHNLCYDLIVLARYLEDKIMDIEIE